MFQYHGYQPLKYHDSMMKFTGNGQDDDRLQRLIRKAKVIIKGDPREFMG